MINYTAKYTKISSGYMGQLIEWPEVVTEGDDLENCRAMLRDAANHSIYTNRATVQSKGIGNLTG